MPWDNVPEELWPKMESCVKDVMDQGKDKSAATAICYSSLVEGKDDELKSLGLSLDAYKSEKESADDGELTIDELLTIDQLYLDVKSGKLTLGAPDETEKAVNNPRPTGDSGGSPGGSPGGHSSLGKKREKCYLHMKKLGLGDKEAHRICSHALGVPGEKETSPTAELSVFKQADGHYRWLAFTSSSYLDREGEIVSQKAQEQDIARMTLKGDYGTLDWWHTPLILGKCDFAAMEGRIRVESGTFNDDWMGEHLAPAAKELGMSLAFTHPLTDPDPGGIYHYSETFSRALLPQGRAANLLTSFQVAKEKQAMIMDKVKELVAKLGGGPEAEQKVAALLETAQAADKAAEQAGLAYKEKQEPPKTEAPAEEKKPETILEQKGMFVADMKPEEFDAHVKGIVEAAVKPFLEELKALKDANAVAVKESSTNVLAAALAEIKKLQDAQAQTARTVQELSGLTPRGFRASQSPETVTQKQTPGPGQDEKGTYFSQFVESIARRGPMAPTAQ